MPGRRCALIVLAALAWPFASMAQDGTVTTLAGISDRLSSCWRAPDLPSDDPGMQITVQFTLKRHGELLGEPRITYETEYMPEERKRLFRQAVAETLLRCLPMPVSDGLGNAIAGRPFAIRFDARRMKSI